MIIMLPDSPVSATLLTPLQRRMAAERLKENQTGIENKHIKVYQIKEAFFDYKLYLFFLLGVVGNVPNGGISNFGTIIIKGFGFSTLVTALMQVREDTRRKEQRMNLTQVIHSRFPMASLSQSAFSLASFSMTVSSTSGVISSLPSYCRILLGPSGFVLYLLIKELDA